MFKSTYLEDIAGTFSTEVVLTWKDNHWLSKHFQTDGTNKLFLQVIHSLLLFRKRLIIQSGAHLLAISRLIGSESGCFRVRSLKRIPKLARSNVL